MDEERTWQAKECPDEERIDAESGEDRGALHADVDAAESAAPPEATEATRPWRIARTLLKLRAQVNALAPGRSKASDGAIGDAAHASRASDHNPWVIDGANGVVTAIDVTHSPDKGCDADKIAESLRASRDPRIKYMIWNKRIVSSYRQGATAAWTWRPYRGRNGHTKHVHVSVNPAKAQYDSEAEWAVRVS